MGVYFIESRSCSFELDLRRSFFQAFVLLNPVNACDCIKCWRNRLNRSCWGSWKLNTSAWLSLWWDTVWKLPLTIKLLNVVYRSVAVWEGFVWAIDYCIQRHGCLFRYTDNNRDEKFGVLELFGNAKHSLFCLFNEATFAPYGSAGRPRIA